MSKRRKIRIVEVEPRYKPLDLARIPPELHPDLYRDALAYTLTDVRFALAARLEQLPADARGPALLACTDTLQTLVDLVDALAEEHRHALTSAAIPPRRRLVLLPGGKR